MSELSKLVLGIGLIVVLYYAWRALSHWALGRFVQVVLTGSVVAALAFGLGFFLFNCVRAILDAVSANNLPIAAYFLLAGAFGFLFYGVLLLGIWAAFARYTKDKLGFALPGHTFPN